LKKANKISSDGAPKTDENWSQNTAQKTKEEKEEGNRVGCIMSTLELGHPPTRLPAIGDVRSKNITSLIP